MDQHDHEEATDGLRGTTGSFDASRRMLLIELRSYKGPQEYAWDISAVKCGICIVQGGTVLMVSALKQDTAPRMH